MITVSTSRSRPPPSTSPRYHHGDLREALVAAGLAILQEGGDPAALSLREAARRAGVSAMAPYRHFADKEALLAEVASVGFARLAAALEAADAAPDPREALVAQGVAYVAFACDNPSLFRLMFGAERPALREGDLATKSQAAYEVLARRVAAINATPNARDWMTCCWATAHGIASLAVNGRLTGEPALAIADRVLRLLDARG